MQHFTMSQKETNQITIFEKLKKGEIKQKHAARELGISSRQVRRKLKAYRLHGAKSLIHKGRGKESNRKINQKKINKAIKLINKNYKDFGPTFAHEKLTEIHKLKLSVETLRQAMISHGIWKAKPRKAPRIHQMRQRRDCFGELIQIDGSPHDWFEGRGNIGVCTLLVYIDDATSKLLHLEFVKSESMLSYFRATKHYLENYGKPLAFYSDKHGVFRINNSKNGSASSNDEHGLTQFGRATKELDIKLIFANTPQAKGRVERANSTLQDRLVKEMRLLGISTIEKANKYLAKYIEIHNQKFSVKAKEKTNMHRDLTKQEKKDLDKIFSIKDKRVLTKNLICQYKNTQYQIQTNRPTYAMIHALVIVRENMKGKISIEYKGKELDYTIYQKRPRAQIVDSKNLNSKVDEIKKNKIKNNQQIKTKSKKDKAIYARKAQPGYQNYFDKLSEQNWNNYSQV